MKAEEESICDIRKEMQYVDNSFLQEALRELKEGICFYPIAIKLLFARLSIRA
jgi:hypothetical protein